MAVDAMREALADGEVRVSIALHDKTARDEAKRVRQARQDGEAEGNRKVARKDLAAGVDRGIVLTTPGLHPEDLA